MGIIISVVQGFLNPGAQVLESFFTKKMDELK